MRRIIPWGVLVVALGVTGVVASLAVGRAGAVHPLANLPGGLVAGPAFEELTDTSVVLTLKTGAPAFCQVNYGTTTAYGLMRRMSMTGPMDDHRILLPGLEPDTLYHVRLTAVDTGARLYQSGDLTFRTKPAGQGAPVGRNAATLAAGARVVGVSSNYGHQGNAGPFGAHNAIDGDAATEWSSNGDGDRAWIEIELPDATRLVAIGFWTRTMGLSAQIQGVRGRRRRDDAPGPLCHCRCGASSPLPRRRHGEAAALQRAEIQRREYRRRGDRSPRRALTERPTVRR